MRRVISALAALAVIVGITALSAAPASAATGMKREFQVQSLTVDTGCLLQSASCSADSATVIVAVLAPACMTRNLATVVNADEGFLAVVGNVPAKCRNTTPTRVAIRTTVASSTAALLNANYNVA